jgi:hypothetical protein
VASFSGVLTLQAQAGVCSNADTNGIGCAETEGTGNGGNPNDLVNCYDVTSIGGTAPFVIDQVRFWIGTSIPLPTDLSVRVFSSASGAPSTQIGSQALSGYVTGANTFPLTTPITVTTNQFCIGINSQNANDGLRIQNEVGSGSQSFVLAPQCQATSFTSLQAFQLPAQLCIEAFVRSP